MVDEVCRRSWPKGTEARVISVIQALVATRADQMAGIAGCVHDINAEERHWMELLGSEADRKFAQAKLVTSSRVEEGDPITTLINEARSRNCDTVFMGARRHGAVDRVLVGSVSASVIACAPCTVEIVRPLRS